MLSGPHVILTLKIAVIAVTGLFLASLLALACGRYRLHGRINIVFFVLTLSALVALEGLSRAVDPNLFAYFDGSTREALRCHLLFAVPAAALLPFMILTGGKHRRRLHLCLAAGFGVLWIGTFITGVFYLPHTSP
ncbi:MAG TPA: hypothetical protein VFA18_23760 [Gemmataceae bacterium]|nr:hypothetical protein [Gemmataceae bacterium]